MWCSWSAMAPPLRHVASAVLLMRASWRLASLSSAAALALAVHVDVVLLERDGPPPRDGPPLQACALLCFGHCVSAHQLWCRCVITVRPRLQACALLGFGHCVSATSSGAGAFDGQATTSGLCLTGFRPLRKCAPALVQVRLTVRPPLQACALLGFGYCVSARQLWAR